MRIEIIHVVANHLQGAIRSTWSNRANCSIAMPQFQRLYIDLNSMNEMHESMVSHSNGIQELTFSTTTLANGSPSNETLCKFCCVKNINDGGSSFGTARTKYSLSPALQSISNDKKLTIDSSAHCFIVQRVACYTRTFI